MKLHIIPYKYEYHTPFVISRERRTHQEALLIGLELGDIIGWGELTTNSYYNVFCKDAQLLIESLRTKIEAISLDHPLGLYSKWKELFPLNSFIRCAFDEASWDLYGKSKSKSTASILGLNSKVNIASCYTLGIGSNSNVLDKIIERPWSIYKMKMGKQVDVNLLEEIREITNAQLYIDVNAAWTIASAIGLIPKIAQQGVSLIEQPLPVELNKEMKNLKGRFRTPFIADESFNDASDLSLCRDLFDGINVKLQKIGGISPAFELIQKAKKNDLKIMIGCMTESSVGLSAAAQLVSLADFADLDSMLLIKNDPAEGVKLDTDNIMLSNLDGNGVLVDF